MTTRKNQDAEEGIAYVGFFGSIDPKPTEELIDTIANQLPEGTHTVYLLISTNGGSTTHGFVIYNVLRALPYKIIMHNVGSVDSIGNALFMAGDMRYCTPDSTFLIHPVQSSFSQGKITASNVLEKISSMEGERKTIMDVILRHTKIPKEELHKLFEFGELKDSTYALEKGMVDEIRDLPRLGALHIVKAGA